MRIDTVEGEKMNRKYISQENMCDMFMICFLITFNIFFGLFVWIPSDLSPNQAIGFISLLFISLEVHRIMRRNKKFAKGRKSE